MVNGYKKTAIGAVPSEWDVLPFGKVFRTLSNNTLSRDQLNYDSGSIKDIHYGDILILFPEVLDCSRDDIPYVNNNASISGQPLQDGDIIISDTAEDETVGKAVEVSNRANTNIVAGLHTIPCRVKNGKFASGWLGYFINSHYYHDQLIPYIHGTKVSSIARESLADTYIVVPPYDEQKKVVAALADISRLISESKKLIAKYQAMKLGCLQHMFPRKGQTEPDIRLPGFTGAWEQRKLGDIAEIVGGGTPSTSNPDYWDGDIDWYTPAEIGEQTYVNGSVHKITREGLSHSSAKILPANKTVLFTSRAGIGNMAILQHPAATNQGFQSLVCHDDIDSYFVFSMGRSIKAKAERIAAGSTFTEISGKKLGELDFLFSNTSEQYAIGTFFKSLDDFIILHQRKCEKYKMIKQGMMEDLLTGKIRLK